MGELEDLEVGTERGNIEILTLASVYHHGDRPRSGKVHCPECGKYIKSKGLKQHMRDTHENSRR